MGTGNFYNKNASRVYSCLESYETPILDEDGEETDEMEMASPESWECDEFIENVKNLLEENGKFKFWDNKNQSFDNNRNYSGTYCGTLYSSRTFGDVEISVNIHAILRSGYYDGANLDWEMSVSNENNGVDYDLESIDELECDFGSGSYLNAGMVVIQARNAQKWANNICSDLIEAMESVFENVSTPLVVVGRFSNGETVYEKADNKRALMKNALL